MGIPVMVLGQSGAGKSASLRNFEPDEVLIFNVAGKPLPFRKKLAMFENPTYRSIAIEMKEATKKTYVIDDSQYLLAFEFFDKAKETGYQKFTNIALNFRNLIQFVVEKTPPDVIVYFLHHTEETNEGRLKAKTIGKMLDEKLTVEGLFSIVLMATIQNNEYVFLTASDGLSTVKTPMEMFTERVIENDLKAVDSTIREYYELGKREDDNVKTA